MIFFLLEWLQKLGLKVPTVFEYSSTRMTLAAATSLALSIFLGPWFIRKLYSLKMGQPIRKEECPLLGQLHEKKKDTPTMGGVLILFSMLVSMFLWMDLTSSFTLILLLTTLVLGLVGGYDDYLKLRYKNTKGLAGRKKMAVQIALGGMVALYLLCPTVNQTATALGIQPPVAKELVSTPDSKEKVKVELSTQEYAARLYVPFFKNPVLTFSGLGLIALAIFYIAVITGSSNAVNLTDGLDGLASGTTVMVAGVLAVIAFLSSNIDIASYLHILYVGEAQEVAVYLSAMMGAVIGFLWYNGHPAQVFMGDIGSLSLGGILGVSAVLLRREFLLAIAGGVFVAEALSVIIQVISYKKRKKRVFLCSPLHHHFEYKGWHETKVVLRFWIIGLFLAIFALASLKFQ